MTEKQSGQSLSSRQLDFDKLTDVLWCEAMQRFVRVHLYFVHYLVPCTLCPWVRHFTCVTSAHAGVKWLPRLWHVDYILFTQLKASGGLLVHSLCSESDDDTFFLMVRQSSWLTPRLSTHDAGVRVLSPIVMAMSWGSRVWRCGCKEDELKLILI